MNIIAILLAGGKGVRFGGSIPKQYIRVNNECIITYCLKTITDNRGIDGVRIVADPDFRDMILDDARRFGVEMDKIAGFSMPGATNRQSSIMSAMKDIKDSSGKCDAVLIHDAARPFVTSSMIDSCLSALNEHDGAMPVLPMTDTVYMSEDGKSVTSLLDRSKLFAGQAPEAFLFDKYYDANLALSFEEFENIKGSSEPAVMAGLDVALIPGNPGNIKITTKEDMGKLYQVFQCGNC